MSSGLIFLHSLTYLFSSASHSFSFFFFFNDTATTEIYTLSLHDALPICRGQHGHDRPGPGRVGPDRQRSALPQPAVLPLQDRKSTRLNSSHQIISYAVFCLKKKKTL